MEVPKHRKAIVVRVIVMPLVPLGMNKENMVGKRVVVVYDESVYIIYKCLLVACCIICAEITHVR